jgi:hypothetical protein
MAEKASLVSISDSTFEPKPATAVQASEEPEQEDFLHSRQIVVRRRKMKKQRNTHFGLISLGIGLAMAMISTPNAFGANLVKADVPFAFQVGNKSMPAGPYELRLDREAGTVEIEGAAKGTNALAGVITSLAPPPHADVSDSHLVFDVVGDKYILSEVWQHGNDGLLLYATKGPHRHHVLHFNL